MEGGKRGKEKNEVRGRQSNVKGKERRWYEEVILKNIIFMHRLVKIRIWKTRIFYHVHLLGENYMTCNFTQSICKGVGERTGIFYIYTIRNRELPGKVCR